LVFQARKSRNEESPLSIRLMLAAGLLLAGSLPAMAADIWEEGGSGAVAILPEPRYPQGITGGSFYCSEQKWGFLFRTDAALALPANGTAGSITVRGEPYPFAAEISPGSVHAPVPDTMLEGLKSGTSMSVTIGEGDTKLAAVFNLNASRRVIEAIAPRCSPAKLPDMAGYERVTLSEMSLAVISAKPLLEDELRLFRQTTGKQPVLAAEFIDVGPGRQLMFASICGSTSYYGDSGCNLNGFAMMADEPEWRQVYNTEGMHLFLDRKAANGGWPSLVTLPVVGVGEPTHWVWGGHHYMLRDQVISEEDLADEDDEEEGDGGQ
jgi:hypothetical protein